MLHLAASSLLRSLLSKSLSFSLSVLAARLTSLEGYGRSHVSLQLLVSACLWPLKEGLRRAALAAPLEQAQVIAGRGSVICVLTSLVCGLLWAPSSSDTGMSAVVLCCLASVLEASVEPLVVRRIRGGEPDVLNRVESWSFVVRACTLSLWLLQKGGSMAEAEMGFGVAQMAYSVSWVASFLWSSQTGSPGFKLGSRGLTLDMFCFSSEEAQWLTLSVQKFLLGEGDRLLLLLFFPSPSLHGSYALVSNLGSLAARLLFAPLESLSFASYVTASSLEEACEHAKPLLLVQALVAVLGCLLGPSLAGSVLRVLYGGERAAQAEGALKAYCVYLGLMAVNGQTEALFTAWASRKGWMWKAQMFHLGISTVGWGVAVGVGSVLEMGAVPVILGNSVAMFLRIVLALGYLPCSQLIHPRLLPLLGSSVCICLPPFLLALLLEGGREEAKVAAAALAGVGVLGAAWGDLRTLVRDMKKDH